MTSGSVPAGLDLEAPLTRLGYTAFRPGQREAIEALLERGRLLLVAPTGGGKSLTYQLPATILPGTTLVGLAARLPDGRSGAGARGARRGRDLSRLDAGQPARCAGAWPAWRPDGSVSSTWRRSG